MIGADIARLFADIAFGASVIIGALERKFAVALAAAGLFLLSLAATLKG